MLTMRSGMVGMRVGILAVHDMAMSRVGRMTTVRRRRRVSRRRMGRQMAALGVARSAGWVGSGHGRDDWPRRLLFLKEF